MVKCEEIVRGGMKLYPNLSREEFFKLEFIDMEEVKKAIDKLDKNGKYCYRETLRSKALHLIAVEEVKKELGISGDGK